MKQIASFSLFILRLVVTSSLALCSQVFLIVKFPDYLLSVQEMVKSLSVKFFDYIQLEPSYRVAYNLVNGDGIVVHTLFVLVAFAIIYFLLTPFRLMFR